MSSCAWLRDSLVSNLILYPFLSFILLKVFGGTGVGAVFGRQEKGVGNKGRVFISDYRLLINH